MTSTKTLRAAIKAIDPEANVSAIRGYEGEWAITTERLDAVRAAIPSLGLTVLSSDVVGGRWNWRYRFEVRAKVP